MHSLQLLNQVELCSKQTSERIPQQRIKECFKKITVHENEKPHKCDKSCFKVKPWDKTRGDNCHLLTDFNDAVSFSVTIFQTSVKKLIQKTVQEGAFQTQCQSLKPICYYFVTVCLFIKSCFPMLTARTQLRIHYIVGCRGV